MQSEVAISANEWSWSREKMMWVWIAMGSLSSSSWPSAGVLWRLSECIAGANQTSAGCTRPTLQDASLDPSSIQAHQADDDKAPSDVVQSSSKIQEVQGPCVGSPRPICRGPKSFVSSRILAMWTSRSLKDLCTVEPSLRCRIRKFDAALEGPFNNDIL